MVKFSLIRLNITNWRINPLRKHLSILGQNDPGLREIFLEFNCSHFGKKIESLQLSCQKLTFGGGCHAPARPYAPVSKLGLLDEGRVPRGVQGRTGARRGVASKTPGKCLFLTV